MIDTSRIPGICPDFQFLFAGEMLRGSLVERGEHLERLLRTLRDGGKNGHQAERLCIENQNQNGMA